MKQLFLICLFILSALFVKGQTEYSADVSSQLLAFAKRYSRELAAIKLPQLVNQRLNDDKVLFRLGKPEDLLQLPDTFNVDIQNGEGYYEMTWSRGTEPFVCIAFPAQNTLIRGLSQRQLVDGLPAEIQQQPKGFTLPQVPSNLGKLFDGVWTTASKSYHLESLNDALFYEQDKDGHFIPVFSDRHRDLSACNLLHGLIEHDHRLYIDLSLFDFSSKGFLVSLSQWINFCRSRKMHVYCGIEEEREDGLKMLLIAEQKELKYNHMLSIIIPNRFVSDSTVVLKARLNGYIPTHNVANLYKQYTEKTNHPKYKIKTSQ